MAVSLRELFRLLIRQIEEPSLTKRAGDWTERPTFSQARTTRGKRPSAKHGRRTRLGARQTRRHLQRSACCRQPVDRRTTRPDRGGIARTNPHADERPFRQRVTRFGHVPAYRASRPLSQHCRGSASGEATAKKPNSSAQSDEAPEKQAARAPEPNVRDRIRPAPGSYDRTCKTSPMRATKPLNQDSIRTAPLSDRIFSGPPAKSGLRTGPGPNASPLSPVPSLPARLRQARTDRGNMGKAQRGSTSPKDFAVPAV